MDIKKMITIGLSLIAIVMVGCSAVGPQAQTHNSMGNAVNLPAKSPHEFVVITVTSNGDRYEPRHGFESVDGQVFEVMLRYAYKEHFEAPTIHLFNQNATGLFFEVNGATVMVPWEQVIMVREVK